MRNRRQNDKLEQWVMHRTVEDDVLGSILGCQEKEFFPCLIVSINNLSIPIGSIMNQFKINSSNPLNKA